MDQVLAADIAGGIKTGRGVIGDLAHHTALMVARQDGEGGAFRLVSISLAPGHVQEEEGKHLQQLVPGEYFAVQELDWVFAFGLRGVGKPHVVPSEVLGSPRIAGGHHVAGVGGQI